MSDKRKRTRRDAAVRVKTAKGRKGASTRWLQRQLNDPYVREAERLGYKSRAAFKLKELDERLGLIKKGMTVLDLGAAPGGWSQVAVQQGATKVIALDILPMDEIAGVMFLQMDFMADEAPAALIKAIGGKVDLALSDMAPNTIGHKGTDHLRIMLLVEAAYDFALEVLKPGGTFVAKVLQGGTQHELLARMKKEFTSVKHIKPPSSRKESAEQYVIAAGYKPQQKT